MPTLQRSSFVQGWSPDADPTNGSPSALLRMDNCILDELGTVALRPGSIALNAPFSEVDCHSLFTGTINGARYRMVGAGNSVLVNNAFLYTGFDGVGDIAFGSHLGQILIARGSTKRKFNGVSGSNWGINPPNGTPTVSGAASDSKTFMTCNNGELPPIVIDEGTSGGFVTGADGTASGAIEINPASATGRASVTRTFVSETNFSVLDGGSSATDDDIISCYVYVANPSNLKSVTMQIDVNANPTNRFQEDYYFFQWRSGEVIPVVREPGGRRRLIDDVADASDIERADAALRGGTNPFPVVKFNPLAGWNKLSVARGEFSRIGSTAGKGWNTVKAVRVIAELTGGGATSLVRVDNVVISGGPITGSYRYVGVLVNNTGTYQAKSGPSALSAETSLLAQGADVTFPGDGGRDPQANELWLYRMGGGLESFYRVAVKTFSGSGAITVRDATSDVDALIANLKLETDNAVPPNNIIGIAGPYYDRTCVLTSDGFVYVSRRLNPDSFASGQAVRVTGPDETPHWIVKAIGGLYIGTSKDVYRLSGTGAELPDGTVDFTLEPLNIDHPPIGPAVAQDGNLLVYLANDGWRVFSGSGTRSINGPTSLLYKGYNRHLVSAVNLSGRIRATIAHGHLVALIPEDGIDSPSNVLYRYSFALDRWYRHTYQAFFRSVAREPDGTLVAGAFNGIVWQLDTGTTDAGDPIDVTLWTVADSDGSPFTEKQAANLQMHVDTGGSSLAVGLHLNESNTSSVVDFVTQSSPGVSSINVTSTAPARTFQVRCAGRFFAFRFAGWTLTYQPMPLGLKAWDSGQMDLGVNELVWVKDLRMKVKATADVTATVYFDGRQYPSVTIPATTGTSISEVSLGKGYKGRIPRVVLTSSGTFYPYWVEVVRRTTGVKLDEATIRIPAQVGGSAAA